MTEIKKLKNLYKKYQYGQMRVSDVFNTFKDMRVNGINEVSVDKNDMITICKYLLLINDLPSKFITNKSYGTEKHCLNIIKKGGINNLFGVKLIFNQ